MRLLFFIFILLIIFIPSKVLFTQNISSPLKPEAPTKQTEIGIRLGFGQNLEKGIYYPRCEVCEFENAVGIGTDIGLVFIRDFFKYLQWGGSLLVQTRNVSTSYQITELVPVELKNGDIDNRPIPFRNNGDFSFTFLSLQPFIQFSPYKFVFFRVGFSSSLITFSNITHTKELLKFRDTLSSGEVVSVRIDDKNPKLKILENRSIPDLNSLQFYVDPMVGFNINLSPQFFLSPFFKYSIPLNDISNNENNFRLSDWRIMLELRMALRLR